MADDEFNLDLLTQRIARAEFLGDFEQMVDCYLLADAVREEYEREGSTVPPELMLIREAHERSMADPRYESIAGRLKTELADEVRMLKARARAEQLIRFYEGGEWVCTKLVNDPVIPGVYKIGCEPVTIDCHFVGEGEVRLELGKDVVACQDRYAAHLARAESDRAVIGQLQELYEDD